MADLGRIAVIANPTAKSGQGARAARQVVRALERERGAGSFELFLTERPRHATEIAQALPHSFDTVLVVGGDGVIHETANGLMRKAQALRQRMGVIPVGSGNDYAASLKMSSRVEKAIAQVLHGKTMRADVGRCNGRYFVETLSFGLDAAIALDTMERRKKSGRSGTLLYFESGIDQMLHHLSPTAYDVTLVDAEGAEKRLRGESFVFAVQLGPTYGGHFKVCPDARLDDGLFDICLCHPPLGAAKATGIFMLAKEGLHTRFKRFEFHKARSLRATFAAAPAAQMDGEKLEGTTFDITTEPAALEVIVGA